MSRQVAGSSPVPHPIPLKKICFAILGGVTLKDKLLDLAVMLTVIVSCITVAVLLLLGTAGCLHHLSFDAEMARIDSIRAAAQVDQYNKYLMTEVAGLNARIRETQALNKIPVFEWTIPDEWEDVMLIPITAPH